MDQNHTLISNLCVGVCVSVGVCVCVWSSVAVGERKGPTSLRNQSLLTIDSGATSEKRGKPEVKVENTALPLGERRGFCGFPG